MAESFWRIDEGGLPGCPVGTVIAIVQEGVSVRVMREGGQIGTLHASTTQQTSTPDGSSITLVNETEGWRAVLSRTTGFVPFGVFSAATNPSSASSMSMQNSNAFERSYAGNEATAMAAFQVDRVTAEAEGWYPTGTRSETGGLVARYERRVPEPAAPWLKPKAPAATGVSWAGIVVVIGGALAVLGSFLPWITATVAFAGTIERNGFDGGGDGVFTAALGIIIALIGVALLARSGKARTARIGAIIAGLALGGLGLLEIGSVNDRIASLGSGTVSVAANVGTGLIVVEFAAVLTIIGAFLPDGRSTR